MSTDLRALLSQRRRLTVQLGTAPDGLPWLLAIDRGTPPERLIQPVARALGVEAPPESWQGPLREIADQVRSLVDSRQFVDINRSGASQRYYLTWCNLKALVGPTVFETLLPRRHADSIATDQGWASEDPGSLADTRAMIHNPAHEDAALERERQSGMKLALALEGDDVAVMRFDPMRPESFETLRGFDEESLSALSSARFCSRSDTGSVVEGGFGQEYAEARRQLSNQPSQWLMTVERRELLRLCARLARHIEQSFHRERRVHGDLKPANLLLLSDGVRAIDSLDVAVGEPSPGLSKDFAAPEQVLGEPLTTAADQYALGVLLTRVAEGLLYGEEARFHIPVSSQRLELFTLLKSPGVFLSPQVLRAPREGLEALRKIIQRCLRFDPSDRFASMVEVADALDELTERHAFEGHLECELRFGTLTQVEDLGLAWLIEDRHP